MGRLSPAVRLSNAIQVLENEQSNKGQLLKDQFLFTYESLKPINLIKNTLREIGSSPILGDNLMGNIMGLATGYLSKKVIVGESSNVLRKILGTVLQFGVANAVAKHPEAIRLLGKYVIQYFRNKNVNNFDE